MNENFPEAAARLDPPPSSAQPAPAAAIGEDDVWQALSLVIGPELGLDIVTVGLVYEIECS